MIFLPLMLLLADPAPHMRVLVLDLHSDGVAPELARLLSEEVVAGLAREETLDVLSAEDLRRVVTLEADKSAAGCTGDDCLAQVASAMGARYVVYGNAGMVGDMTVVHLNLFDTQTQRGIARETADAATRNELLGSLRAALGRIRTRIAPPSNAVVAAPAPAPALSTMTVLGGAVAGVGAVAALGGIVGAGLALSTVYDLNRAPSDRQGAQSLGAGSTLVAVGGVTLAAVGGGILAWGLAQ